MVKKITIGVISVQGAISEHIFVTKKALEQNNTSGNVMPVKYPEDFEEVDGLIIPGGESTTISRNLHKTGLFDKIIEKNQQGDFPIMGTCAGCVILAKEIVDPGRDVKLLKFIDMKVKRNAFGPQIESFEKKISVEGIKNSFNAVFIRAPIIKNTWDDCNILSKIDDQIVMVKQGKKIGVSFHPELTDDTRIHRMFIDTILEK